MYLIGKNNLSLKQEGCHVDGCFILRPYERWMLYVFNFLLLQHHTTSGDIKSDVFRTCLSKVAFMKAPDEYGTNKDFNEKSTDWIAIAGKRCTDEEV